MLTKSSQLPPRPFPPLNGYIFMKIWTTIRWLLFPVEWSKVAPWSLTWWQDGTAFSLLCLSDLGSNLVLGSCGSAWHHYIVRLSSLVAVTSVQRSSLGCKLVLLNGVEAQEELKLSNPLQLQACYKKTSMDTNYIHTSSTFDRINNEWLLMRLLK